MQALVDEVLANNRDLRAAAAARVRQQQLLAEAHGAERLVPAGCHTGAQRQRAYTPAGTVANGNVQRAPARTGSWTSGAPRQRGQCRQPGRRRHCAGP